jgi:NAD dependent epimerase/dehydratase family enzyme
MGVANWIGQGNQYLSWVHRADVVGATLHLMGNETVEGPVNVTAPEPVTSKGFCDAMKRQHRTFLTMPMPAPVMRVMVGEMADELLLTGQRVVPGALQEHGFTFQYASIDSALAAIEA